MKPEVSPNNKLAILITNMRGGGAEKVVLNLANHWVNLGFEVQLLLLHMDGVLLDQLDKKVKLIDLNVKHIIQLPFYLSAYLRREKPAALLACMWPITAASVLAKFISLRKFRLVLAEHTTWTIDPLYERLVPRFILRATMRLLFPFADHVLAVSTGAANNLANVARLPRKKIIVQHNPVVEVNRDDSLPLTYPSSWFVGGGKRVLSVGNLKEIKDFDTLLRGFALLAIQEVSARLIILGEGECRSSLLKLANELGIQEKIELPGYIRDPNPYYQRADLFVLSSRGEGLSNVIIEALSFGLPVVSTDCPSGPREILEDGKFGTLVPVGNPSALGQAMINSLRLRHNRDALVTRALDFSVESISMKYLKLMLPTWDFKD